MSGLAIRRLCSIWLSSDKVIVTKNIQLLKLQKKIVSFLINLVYMECYTVDNNVVNWNIFLFNFSRLHFTASQAPQTNLPQITKRLSTTRKNIQSAATQNYQPISEQCLIVCVPLPVLLQPIRIVYIPLPAIALYITFFPGLGNVHSHSLPTW